MSTGAFCGPYPMVLIMYVMLTNAGKGRGARRVSGVSEASGRCKPSRNAPDASRLKLRARQLLRAQLFDDGLQRLDHFVLVDA
jgi:hypothetical protein